MGKKRVLFVCVHNSARFQRCPVFPSSAKRLHWSFEDQAGFKGTWEEKLEKTRQVRDKIKQKIEDWLKEQTN